MRTVTTIEAVRATLAPHRGSGPIGLVPTMGALHAGHLALIAAAREECETVVVSLFVNPSQFGSGEDLDRYPRDPERDGELSAAAGADLLFAPSAAEMYPEGFQTAVDVREMSRGLEGDIRPGHFSAVATVCLKLLNIVRPDRAYFGQKDAQQLAVVAQLIRDLDVEVELRSVATVRDEDGLALSSRNVYLTPDQRASARALPRALEAGLAAYRNGIGHPDVVARTILLGERDAAIDYCELARWNGRLVLAAAIRLGETRLLDNVILEGAQT